MGSSIEIEAGLAALSEDLQHAFADSKPDERYLEGLLRHLIDIQTSLEGVTDAGSEGVVERAAAASSVLLRIAASIPATSVEGVLCKLAMWRWEETVVPQAIADMDPSEAIVYSAFRDLVCLTADVSSLADVDNGWRSGDPVVADGVAGTFMR